MNSTNAQEIINRKLSLAREMAARNGGWLTRKEFAYIAEMHVSQVSILINSPDFGEIIRKKTEGGRGAVKIPSAAAEAYILAKFVIE